MKSSYLNTSFKDFSGQPNSSKSKVNISRTAIRRKGSFSRDTFSCEFQSMHWAMELFSRRRWRLDRPKQKAVVFVLNPKNYVTCAWHYSIVVWLLGRSSCSSPDLWYQCDQIWRIFATLAQRLHFLAIMKGFIKYLAIFWGYYGKFYTILGKLSLLQMAKY